MKKNKKKDKKKCFVITPIGKDDSDVRRHIDGIIDQAVIPALEEEYIVDVAHRKYEIGSINDRVIRSVYEADLIIANLTGLNPNVMFELAIRYSFGKPVIVIAEKGTKLPFDIIDENTIFYINDPKGANDLKDLIIKFEKNIIYDSIKYGPVYKAVNKIPLYTDIEEGKTVSSDKQMAYIIDRLDSLERNMGNSKYEKSVCRISIIFKVNLLDKNEKNEIRNKLLDIKNEYNNLVNNIEYNAKGFDLILYSGMDYFYILELITEIEELMENYKIDDYDIYL